MIYQYEKDSDTNITGIEITLTDGGCNLTIYDNDKQISMYDSATIHLTRDEVHRLQCVLFHTVPLMDFNNASRTTKPSNDESLF